MNYLFLRRFCLLGLCSCFIFGARAQQTNEKFVQETRYLLALPDGYGDDSALRWPLVLFLHGSGESGSDLQKVKMHGPPQLVEQGKKFPFMLISPQSDYPGGWDIEMLYKLLQHIKKNYRVDEKRIYLTGLSMGGFGTWALAMKHPEEFAALIPVCGGGDTTTAWKLRNIPIWCFHGAKDNVVPPSSSINLVNAAKRLNPDVRFTLYPEATHNSWDLTYSNDSVYQWMLSQTRFHYTEVTVQPTVLRTYTGTYLGPDGDTVKIILQNDALIAKPPGHVVSLRAAGDNLFFIEADKNMDIRFLKDKKGKTTDLLFLGDRSLLYRKIQ
ncbi:MAG: prolyl oligopeptidase family serine peptidase [Flavisolibacter sp.]